MTERAWYRALNGTGIIILALLPILFALWFAQRGAVTETHRQQRVLGSLLLNKSERVTQQISLAFDAASAWRGARCSRQHQQQMLDIVRGRLYVEDLIYADGNQFLCSTAVAPGKSWTMPAPNYRRLPDVSIYYYRDTPFFPGYRMIYMQRGHYAAVVNPLSFSQLETDDSSLIFGMFDTQADEFFTLSEGANPATLKALIKEHRSTFADEGRFYTIVHSEVRPIAIIVSSSYARYYQNLYHQLALALAPAIICTIIILLLWGRIRQRMNSPERRLQRAIDRRQLELYYQPIIDVKTHQCVGAEALLRWPGAAGQIMSPAEFIPLAESQGLIEQITDYVVNDVFVDLGDFLHRNPQMYVSINLAASDFLSSRLISVIGDKTRRYRVGAEQIKIEVTERAFIDVPKAAPVIEAFRQNGYEVAIDDFGTGYSNLYNLYSLNVDILKIDKSFVDTLTDRSSSHLIIEHIIEMAQSLRLKIIAEGVETEEQVGWLYKRGVHLCQGWYFARAMPRREFVHWQRQAAPEIASAVSQAEI